MGPLIDVPAGLVNGARCKMVSLSWLPKVKHRVIDMLRKGTLRPKPDGGAYRVPPPYTINIEFTNRDGSATIVTPSMSQFSETTDRNRDSHCTGSISHEQSSFVGFTTVAPTSVIPVLALSSGDDKNFRNARGETLKVKHHYIDLGFSFTDYKVQGLTVKRVKS